MAYIFLLGAVCCSALLSITASTFNKKNAQGLDFSTLYNLIVTLSSFFVWTIVFLTDSSFDAGVILYSVGFGIFYVMAFVGLYYAMGCGSASMTAFVKQLSLIIVAIWGFAFWENPVSSSVVAGLVLVFVSLWFCFRPSKDGKTGVRWFVFSLLTIVGNAGCSIVQKYQQINYSGSHGSLLMFGATFVAALLCLAIYTKGDRPKMSDMKKLTVVLPVIAGVSSAALNIFVLNLIASDISESVFFPIIGVGGIIFTTLFSVLAYKEKMSRSRLIGLAIGLVAIVLLNI